MTQHPEAGPFRSAIEVRWSDFDRYNHVNNAAYLEYAQDARVAFFRGGLSALLNTADIPPAVVRHVEIDFLRPILPDTRQVYVDTEITRVGNTSYTLEQTIKDQHENVSAIVKSVMVLFDLEKDEPIAISASNRRALEHFSAKELS